MNMIKREWLGYRKQTIYWIIGMVALVLIAFFKVGSMTTAPGGVEEMLNSLPPMLQAFFGAGALDYTTGVGSYSMIHLYFVIALAFHSVILGSNIFSKEELDKTYEFLYVKGVKRWIILCHKVIAGVTILLLINIVCLVSVFLASMMMNLSFSLSGMIPFMVSLFIVQLFFFAFGLLTSLTLKNSQKAAMIGCAVILVMFMVSMYMKLGGSIDFIDRLSLFHYADTSYIKAHNYGGISTLIIILISLGMFGTSGFLHEHRDLL
ncbi:MAG: ABC transporter permease subunit [Coprobacillus sp.]